ncbi:hypothetical protein [Heyndrickxia coagulans]|uniref:hypothetical protein n=1 Tax=Heyndrickxia coagulans TaxID=1398 RepID=UPI0004274913|nr:hypothetical protein [Heyndrickxia coagulans]
MRVTELRKLLEKYSKDDLSKMMIELYKAIPKKVRDEKEIDWMLQDFQQYKEAEKIKKGKEKHVDLNDLEREITQFIQNAYKQNYIAPNRYVSKKERPKWRFKVKSYIKQLQQIPVEGNEGKRATDLLEKLYEMLCYGCGYYIFNTDNPFRSIGMEQVELFDIILKRKFSMGINKETISSALKQIINYHLDMDTLRSYLFNVFIANLRTVDAKEIAIEQCHQFLMGLKQRTITPEETWVWKDDEYSRERNINELVETAFKLKMELCEYESAIRYFKSNIQEESKEDALFSLLNKLKTYNQKNYWLREYEAAVKKGIRPREELQFTYQYLKENGEFNNK